VLVDGLTRLALVKVDPIHERRSPFLRSLRAAQQNSQLVKNHHRKSPVGNQGRLHVVNPYHKTHTTDYHRNLLVIGENKVSLIKMYQRINIQL
jgi:hypothetical protein